MARGDQFWGTGVGGKDEKRRNVGDGEKGVEFLEEALVLLDSEPVDLDMAVEI
jgi:hypothetical protein